MTRRDALKTLGAGVALAGLAAVAGRAVAADVASANASGALGWDLPKLPFAYAALEPHIDARTMEIHHTKHHQAYITNAKKLLESHPELLAKGPEALVRDLASVPEAIRTGLRNNAGGHVNHAFFWQLLAPAGSSTIGEKLRAAIARDFGSLDGFKKQFADAAMKRFGSGWAWLVTTSGQDYVGKPQLRIVSTANQDSPLTADSPHNEPLTPVLGLDVWEHAYYLHYQNRRGDYVNAFWNVVNWSQAEANYVAAVRA